MNSADVRDRPGRDDTAPGFVLPSPRDVQALADAFSNGALLGTESFDADDYLDGFIWKPWGEEYRVYADQLFDIWKLQLAQGQATSLHCHPRKETALLCLSGCARVSFMARAYELHAPAVIHIKKGVFHRTENLGDTPLDLVEVEVPRNKLDLVRCADRYGRQKKAYETRTLNHAGGAIESFDRVYRCKSRSRCIRGVYSFDVRAGMDLVCRPEGSPIFIVSLSISNGLAQTIDVQRGAPQGADRIESDAFYFTISRVEPA